MINTINLIFLISIYASSFNCDDKTNYEIIYEYQQGMGLDVKVPDSIEMVRIDENGDSIRSKIKMKLDKDLFNFSLKIICTGNKESSLIRLENSSENNGIQTNTKTPDSLIFKNKKWFSYSESKVKEVPIINSKIKKTGLFKIILDYRCEKNIVWDEGNENPYEVWVCDELPNTLMPGAGYKPLDGAILEVYFPDKKSHFIAKKITKL